MTESNEWRRQNWLLLVLHDDSESLEHPYLKEKDIGLIEATIFHVNVQPT